MHCQQAWVQHSEVEQLGAAGRGGGGYHVSTERKVGGANRSSRPAATCRTGAPVWVSRRRWAGLKVGGRGWNTRSIP